MNWNSKQFFLVALFIFPNLLFAQKSMLTGNAKSYANQELRVYAYDDFLTLKEKLVAKTDIDSAGNFKLFVSIDFTQFVFIKTESSRSSFYIEPGKNYYLSIPKAGSKEIATLGTEAYVPIKIKSADSLELNNLMYKFENYLDNFYQKNLALIARKAIKKEAEAFKNAMQKRFAASNSSYFKKYMHYKLATLEAAGGYNERYIFKNYFSTSVDFKSLEYIQFFSQTFTKHLEQLSGSTKGASIENNISVKRNYSATMSTILRADTLFKNDTLRELLLLKGLNEFYYVPKINKQNILSLLAFIEKNGKGADNKRIAHNTIAILTNMAVGSQAPFFVLPNIGSKLIKLSDYKGKYIYLDFWASWCLPCLQEMKLKQTLKEKYGDDIVFISISLDKKFGSMKSYLDKNKNLTSIFLFGGEDDNLKENYNVKAIPTYYLIDREGELFQSPAKKPSEGIELLFQQLLKQER